MGLNALNLLKFVIPTAALGTVIKKETSRKNLRQTLVIRREKGQKVTGNDLEDRWTHSPIALPDRSYNAHPTTDNWLVFSDKASRI